MNDKALKLIDRLVPKFVALAEMNRKDSLKEINMMFRRCDPETVAHLMNHWVSKKAEFGSFYLNLGDDNQRKVLEHFGVPVEPDKFSSHEKMIQARLKGMSTFDIHPFETRMLFQFLLMANNNSLDHVETLGEATGAILEAALKKSRVNRYGTGTNWGKFYRYLLENGIAERSVIVDNCMNYE